VNSADPTSPSSQARWPYEQLATLVRALPPWLFALLSLFGIFVLYQLVGGVLTFVVLGTDLDETTVTAYRVATMGAQVVFLLVPTLLLARLRFPSVRNVFRFERVQPLQIALALVSVLALQQMLQVYLLLQDALPIELPPLLRHLLDQLREMMEQLYRTLTAAESFGEFLFVVFVIAVTPAVCEELLFRGLIQRALEGGEEEVQTLSVEERRKRSLTAAVTTGIVFACYHLNPFTFVPLAALGVYFGYLVYRTQNILPAIAAHFFNNFLACLAVYLGVDENFIALSPGDRLDPGTIALTVAVSTAVFGAATYLLIRRTSPRQLDRSVPTMHHNVQ